MITIIVVSATIVACVTGIGFAILTIIDTRRRRRHGAAGKRSH